MHEQETEECATELEKMTMTAKSEGYRNALVLLLLALISVSAQTQPSGLTGRVLVAVQNPSGTKSTDGSIAIAPQFSMQIVSATTDSSESSGSPGWFSGWNGAMPSSIQNLPAEHVGAVYREDGTLSLLSYSTEAVTTTLPALSGPSSAILLSHDQRYVVAANQQAGDLTIIDRNSGNTIVTLNLPGAYGVSINNGSSVFLAFAQDSDAVYYLRRLSPADSTAYANHNWPANAADCEPLNLPTYCMLEVNSGTSGASTYSQQNFDHPFKALFSADGASVYILNGGPGSPTSSSNTAGITVLPVAPLLFADGTQSGAIPPAPGRITIQGMVSTGIVSGSTVYLAGQSKTANGPWGGELSIVNMSTSAVTPVSIADGLATRMIMADDNTLWIGSMRCNTGYRALNNLSDGCLTVVNISSNSPWVEAFAHSTTASWLSGGDVTGFAAILGLHKVYYVENGQVYIRNTVYPYNLMNNANVATIGTAVDVAFIDTTNDGDNTIY